MSVRLVIAMYITGERNTYIGALPHVVATLLVLNHLVLFRFAAAEGDTAGLNMTDIN